MLKRTDDLPNALFNITVKEVRATGIDVAGLLESQNVTAKKIILNQPQIHIINTGADKPKVYSSKDTLELYEKILGHFKTIKADEIQVNNGTVLITNLQGKSLTTLENINVTLNNFLVDSTRNYDNIISYFIKDVRATVENIQLPPSSNNTRINIEKFDYDAVNKTLKAGVVRQYKINNTQPLIDLKNILLTGLSTDSFILYQQFKAASISCDGGLITINKVEKVNENKSRSVTLTSDIIDNVQVGSVKLGNTKIVIANPSVAESEPFVLNDVQFEAKILKVNAGNTVSDLINNAQWKLRSSGFSFFTKDKGYKLIAGALDIDNVTSVMNIKQIALTPLLGEEAFMKGKTVQGDRYDFVFNNIQLQNIDLNKLINENKIEIQQAALQANLKIYNDRTLPYDTRSKVGMYPHQSLLKLNMALYVNQLKMNNSYIIYKERGRISKLTGNVFFSNLNATINNLTNIEEKIKVNGNCQVIASTNFFRKS